MMEVAVVVAGLGLGLGLGFPSLQTGMHSTCSKKCARGLDKACFVVKATAKKSTSKSSSSSSTSSSQLSRILWTEAAIQAIDRKAAAVSPTKYKNLWPKAVLEALDESVRLSRSHSALGIFALLRKQQWYHPRCQTYTKLLTMLAKCGEPEQASLLFDLLLSDGLRPTLDVFTALVNAYGLSALFDKAFSTIEDMKSVYHCKPDAHTYSVLLNSCIKHRRFDLVPRIFADMSYLGIRCNTVTYNTVIDGYGKAGLFEPMESLLSEMVETATTCSPDVFTMNSFIWAYGNAGHIDHMERCYEEFLFMGIAPDVRTFNILISSYGKAALYHKLESVLSYMSRRFFSPTVVTYNTLIDVFGRAGNMSKMEEFFLKMKHQGMKPNTVTYCSLFNAFSKAGKFHKLDSILRQVHNSDVIVDTRFYNCAINAYGRAGNILKVRELFLEMKQKGCHPDHITSATIARALKNNGMTTEDIQDFTIPANATLKEPSC